MARRLTNAEKERYRIDLSGINWMGRCPSCDYVAIASDWKISQAAVVEAVRKHEEEVHNDRSPMRAG